MTTEEQRLNQMDLNAKNVGFFKRYRSVFVAVGGLLVMHVVWYRLVDTYVPEDEKPKMLGFPYLRKLDPFRREEVKK